MSLASANGSIEVVEVLLEFGAQVNLPNDVRWRIQLIIYRLMHLGLPQNVWGNTALSRASGGGHAEIAKVLLEHGAYVDYRNKVHLL